MSKLRVDTLSPTDDSKDLEVSELLSGADVGSGLEAGKLVTTTSTGGVPTIQIPSKNGQRLYINKNVTTNDDLTVLQVNRKVNVSGGKSGYVGTALVATTDVTAKGKGNYEWTALFVMNSNVDSTDIVDGAASPQNVAIYGQSKKNGTAATWAGCLEIQDNANSIATGATIGLEVTAVSRGADTATPQRIALHAAIKTPSDNTIGTEWGVGLLVSTEGTAVRVREAIRVIASVGDAVLYSKSTTDQTTGSLIKDEGNMVRGIDLSSATYTSNQAIRLASGHRIALDLAGTNSIYGDTAGTNFTSRINVAAGIAFPGSLTSSSANPGSKTLPSAPDGFITISIDGVNKKLPYYAA